MLENDIPHGQAHMKVTGRSKKAVELWTAKKLKRLRNEMKKKKDPLSRKVSCCTV